MLERDILVRILSSAETSGEITVLLSDKTGTITENNQRVNHAWIAGSDLGPLDLELGKTWRDEVARSPNLDSTVLTLFSVLVVLNSTVTYGCDGGILRGSKSEIALIDFANSINENENFSRSISEWFPVLALFPFTAERKRMCSLFMLRDSVDNSEVGDTVVRATVKGAAIDVLELCTDVMLEHGSRRTQSASFSSLIETLSATSFRPWMGETFANASALLMRNGISRSSELLDCWILSDRTRSIVSFV